MPEKEEKKNAGTLMAETAPALVKQIGSRARGRPAGTVKLRPEEHQAEIVTRLCTGESLQMICLDPAMPSLRTVNRWLSEDSDFADTVAGARQLGVHTLMEAAYNIAGGGELSTGSIERDKLLCSVIKWLVAKRDPEGGHRIGGIPITVVLDEAAYNLL